MKMEPVSPPLVGPSTTTTINHPKGCLLNKNKATLSPRNSRVNQARELWDRLFDEAYRSDVRIHTDDDAVIYAHANILGLVSPVFRSMFKKSRSKQQISIHGVPAEAVRIFIRFLYSSCYEESQMEEHILSLLVLSHAFVVPQLKRECEHQLEHKLLNLDNVVDVFQLSILCDAPRLSIICQRFVLMCYKAAASSAGWKAMRSSNPNLEKKLIECVKFEDHRRKENVRKLTERKVYLQLYEAMEALVHICKDGCGTVGPQDKVVKEDQKPCKYVACKGLESLMRHFGGCKLKVPGGCHHCKRMWQLLELHSRICADSNVCKVPLCRKFKQRIAKENKKKKYRDNEMKWKILVRKIMRTKSITGAPYFTLASSSV
ncbi:BTB/POZ and TAZ domain-containing protein 4-like isoform X2 [Rutidosis leptorrhynchoides]